MTTGQLTGDLHPRCDRRAEDSGRAGYLQARSEDAILCEDSRMADVRVGLCGFTIGFEDYVHQFPVVEVQQTFYEPPRDSTMRRWRALSPADFEFTLKAWQLITHDAGSPTYRRLRMPLTEPERADVGSFRWTPTVRDAWSRTLDCVTLLRATAVLLQCPSSFRPTEENVARMRQFFHEAERP